MFYRQELASLIQAQEELKAFEYSKYNFFSCCLIADETRTKIICPHTVVSKEHVPLCF